MFARLFAFLCDILFPLADTARMVRVLTPAELGNLVSPLVTATGAVALLPYRHPLVRAVIIEAKFKRNPHAFSLLANVLADYLASMVEETAEFDQVRLVIVPVPLGPKRLKERGYNQVEEIARRSGVESIPSLLRRTRDTAAQTSLTRSARLQNMHGAFRMSGVLDPEYTYVVLDDVTTTGSTLEAAMQALSEHGESNVIAVALAH